jgi:hypothetical protein
MSILCPFFVVFHELHHRTVVGLVKADLADSAVKRFQQNLHSLGGLRDALDTIGHVRHRLHRPLHGAIRLVSQPFDVERMLLEVRNPNLGRRNEPFAGLLLRCNNADVIELHGCALRLLRKRRGDESQNDNRRQTYRGD